MEAAGKGGDNRKRELSTDTDTTDTSMSSPTVTEKKEKQKEKKKAKMSEENQNKEGDLGMVLKSLNDLNRKNDDLARKLESVATKDDIKDIRGDMDRINKSLTKRIDVLENRVYELEREKDSLSNRLSAMKMEKEEMTGQLQRQRQKQTNYERDLNDLEQYGRGWNLRFFGFPETNDETVSDCINKIVTLARDELKIDIDSGCVEIAHRTGQRHPTREERDGVQAPDGAGGVVGGTGARAGEGTGARRGVKSRPIIARFHSRVLRDQLLANRKVLKGKSVSIGEDLTPQNFRCLKKVQEHSATLSTWSHRGRILTKLKNGVVLQVHASSNIDELLAKGLRGNTN